MNLNPDDISAKEIARLAVRKGIKEALMVFYDAGLRASEISYKYDDKKRDAFVELFSSRMNGDAAPQVKDIGKSFEQLSDCPIDLMATGIILFDSKNEVYKAIAKFYFQKGYESYFFEMDKKLGRPVSKLSKLAETITLLVISFESENNSLNSLYREYADIENKSKDTIRRRYERYNQENPSLEDKLVYLFELFEDYVKNIAAKYFYNRIVGQDFIEEPEHLHIVKAMFGGDRSVTIYDEIMDESLLIEVVVETSVKIIMDVTGKTYDECFKDFQRLSKNLNFDVIDLMKELLRYGK